MSDETPQDPRSTSTEAPAIGDEATATEAPGTSTEDAFVADAAADTDKAMAELADHLRQYDHMLGAHSAPLQLIEKFEQIKRAAMALGAALLA